MKESKLSLTKSYSIQSLPISTHNGSNLSAYVNIICVVAGTGILGLPYAVKLGGWISILFFILSGYIAIYTGNLLIECLYYKKGERLLNYPEIGFEAYGDKGMIFVQCFHYLNLLSCSCIYIMLTGMSIYDLLIPLKSSISVELWILIAGFLIMIPTIFMKSLKEVSILAIFGMLATVVVVVAVIICSSIELQNGIQNIHHDLFNYKSLPLALGTIAFSYGGINVYPHIESTMKNPKQFKTVLSCSIITTTTMYILVAIFGYLIYGDQVQSPILKSLPQGILKILSTSLITAHVFLAAPIFLCSFAYEIELKFDILKETLGWKKELFYRFLIRSSIVFLITLIAMFMPFFNDFMSLFGAVSNCVLVFILPIIYHYKLFGNKKILTKIFDFIVIFIGLIGLFLGSYQSIINLINDFTGNAHLNSSGAH